MIFLRAATIAFRRCLLSPNHIVAACVFILIGCSHTPEPYPGLKQLPGHLQALVDEKQIPGAVVMVAEKGQLLHRSVVGYQDLDTRKPMQDDSIFRLYSMSKPITSVAIMMLKEEGKLSLEDPLEKYIPAFKNVQVYHSGELDQMVLVPTERSITLGDLLAHTAGITYHFSGNTPVHQFYRKYGVKRKTPVGSLPTDGPAAVSLEELVQRIADAPLLHQPGERFSYSYSTTLLGYVIEQVSGLRLDVFLQERLFTPLDMVDTGFFVQGDRLDRLVTNYRDSDGVIEVIETRETTDYKDSSRLLDGGGALAGTAQDYLNFAMMLANEGRWKGRVFLQADSVAELFKARASANNFDFGLGFSIGNKQTQTLGMLPDGAYGWSGSGNTFFWVEPKHHRALVFMTQVIGSKAPLRTLAMDSYTQ